MPNARRPEFSTTTQHWHWWADPAHPITWAQEKGKAQPIDITWTMERDGQGGRRWSGRFEALSGFAPFLWNIEDDRIWLGRPEGIWVAPLPILHRRDYLSLKERHPLLSSGHRTGVIAFPDSEQHTWHVSGTREGCCREDLDRTQLITAWVKGHPAVQTPTDPYRMKRKGPVIELPRWSEPGPLKFQQHKATIDGQHEEEDVLVITLPNDLLIVEQLANDLILQTLIRRGDVWAELGDDRWAPAWKQKIIV